MKRFGLPPLRTGRYGSAAFFGFLVTIPAAAVDPAVYEPALTPKPYVLLLVAGLAAFAAALAAVMRRRGAMRITAIELALVLLTGWGFVANPRWLSSAAGTWFWVAVSALLLILVTRQLFGAAAHAGGQEATRRAAATADLLCAICICGSLVAVHGLAEAVAAGSLHPDGTKTALQSTLSHPNGFGAFVAAGIIAAAFAAAQARTSLGRAGFLAAALLQLVALIGNASRGAMLGLLTAAAVTAWLHHYFGSPGPHGAAAAAGRRRRKVVRAVTGVGVLLAVVAAGLLLNRLNPASGRGRLIAWEISAAMISDHPLTGVGTGRFGAEYGTYQAELWRDPAFGEWNRQASTRDHPNSEYLHVAAEQGIPGLLLFLLPWAVAAFYLLRPIVRRGHATGPEAALLALLIGVLVHAGVDRVLHWMPNVMIACLVLGLVPAPTLLRLDLGRRLTSRALLAGASAWLIAIGVKCGREYPGYRFWVDGERAGGARRVELLARAHRRLPPDPRIDLRLGTVLLQAGQPEAAVGALQRALDHLDGFTARLTLARTQLELGRLAPAELHARTALSRFPDRLGPQLLLARIHHATGEDAQARAALARCIRRETFYRSSAVDSVAHAATVSWRNWYDDEPPG